MKRLMLAAGVLSLTAASQASAQDLGQFAALFAAGTEGFGQSVGEAMTSGSSLFVTATGRTELPAPLTDAYLVNIEGRSPSAVEAYRLRDERLKTARSLATRFGVAVEVGSTGFTREVDSAAQTRRRNQMTAERLAHPGVPVVEPVANDDDRLFVARTGARFRAADPKQLPAFLDALKAAGVDNVSGGLGAGVGVNLFTRSTEVLGFGALEKVDDGVWDRATQAAMAEARRQATVMAASAGRSLGEVKSVLLLTRNLQGSAASVTVAVRFAFAGAR